MNPFLFIMAAFIGVPVAEIYVLITVGGEIGAPNTIGLVIITAIIGAALVRSQGLATLSRIQSGLQQGASPGVALVEGAFILFAGALLLTPGFITDAIGFLCVIPTTRRWLATMVAKRALAHATRAHWSTNSSAHATRDPGGVIDGEFSREPDSSGDPDQHRDQP